ncbi:phosphatidylglycerophosphatase A [Fulvimarina sp. 2208YS6-2-32]|uniref:Phosphatidylglycerophosphatase A n=1 Tax=Fulvimarina uroteuthidis TaxID=3098149 RepID=A0ABU5I618_9HYPH|nr:phosphatidylglycerophosphatase A [Fulvimarina sp. 2208YS6-2-32]MDY8110824.1 phosphatidylglycerophosphatase A [Fulvimarina sp. 2208YS6-2-32]
MLPEFSIALLPEAIGPGGHAALLIASWFGAGFVEPLRASLAVASVWPLAVLLAGRSALALALAAFSVAIVGAWSAEAWQDLLSIRDDRRIVADEVAGYLAGLALLGRTGWFGAAGFGALFLLLDRLKPWPFDRMEAMAGGVGVVADDLAVGMFLGLAILLVRALRTPIGGK